MNPDVIFMEQEIKELKAKVLYRQLKSVQSPPEEWVVIDGKKLLNLCSNNYLGLANDPRIKLGAMKALEDYGFGATASRLVVGNYDLYDQLENEIASFKGTEGALVFNSGYTANIGVIQALVGREDVVISDKLNHASIIDGILLSRAEHLRFKHRDMASLEQIMQKCDGFRRKLIITDSVFSMDGDFAPLKGIVRIKEKYGALFMVDEAHSSGVFGEYGSGLAEMMRVSKSVDIHMGTLSKAFGGAGAYIAGSKMLIDYLKNRCRSLIYTTALPPVIIGGLLTALKIVQDEPWRREKLLVKAELLRKELQQKGFDTLDSESQIIPILIGSNIKALEFSQRLYAENMLVTAIRPPAVPVNTARLRLTLMSTHRDEDLEVALAKLAKIARELKVI